MTTITKQFRSIGTFRQYSAIRSTKHEVIGPRTRNWCFMWRFT